MDILGILDPDPHENLCGSETLIINTVLIRNTVNNVQHSFILIGLDKKNHSLLFVVKKTDKMRGRTMF